MAKYRNMKDHLHSSLTNSDWNGLLRVMTWNILPCLMWLFSLVSLRGYLSSFFFSIFCSLKSSEIVNQGDANRCVEIPDGEGATRVLVKTLRLLRWWPRRCLACKDNHLKDTQGVTHLLLGGRTTWTNTPLKNILFQHFQTLQFLSLDNWWMHYIISNDVYV